MYARHATAKPDPQKRRWYLHSAQGFIEQQGIKRRSLSLSPGEHFILGQTILTVPDLTERLPGDWSPEPPGAELQVTNLHVERGGKTLINNITLKIDRKRFAVILGPSGAGKTTLLHVMLGEMAPDDGEVTVDELTVAAPQDPAHQTSVIRYVPREIALYQQLSVRRTLWYAIALRAASDMSWNERRRRVTRLATDVGIAHRLRAPVYQLSDGERKRLSLAVELAATPKPHLLILDEPGSGLDVGNDRKLMKLLLDQSRAGTTVVCVTHNVDNIECADDLIVLGQKGKVCFSGCPQDALKDLGKGLRLPETNWAEAMTTLAGDNQASGSKQQQRTRKGNATYAPRPTRLLRPLRTWWLLSCRQLALTLSCVRPNSLLAQLPREMPLAIQGPVQALCRTVTLPLLGAFLAIVSAEAGWRDGPDARQLALLATVAALTGASLTYSDLVSEERAIKREYRLGVSGWQVVSAKLTIAAAQSAILTLIMVAIYTRLRPLGGRDSLDFPSPGWAVSIPVFLVMLASSAAGLLISAWSNHLKQAVTGVTALAIMQVSLNNVLFNLPPPLLPWLAMALPSRMGVAAQAAYLGLPHDPTDLLWSHTFQQWLLNNVILIVLTASFTAIAGWQLDRRCRRMD
ncbi:ATP-binding cassette domain-containing protein [Streptomyces sp. NBC_00444]|uniref:ATP-binding cassette domain-containing protein n=1 Tax=Streptomyces sp. NBC_00444 TaxID=2975744 RepID=UPI002E21039B